MNSDTDGKNLKDCDKTELAGEKGEKTGNNGVLTVANAITALRIICAAVLIFLKFPEAAFIAIYSVTGITDAFDGWIARRTGTAGKFGSTLDSIADLLFYSVSLIKILPVLWRTLHVSVWYAVAVILLIRFSAYVAAAIRFRRFASIHTILNKATGVAVFLLPYAVLLSWETVYCWIVAVLALFSSTEEFIIHLTQKTYCGNAKSVFCIKSADDKREENTDGKNNNGEKRGDSAE